MSKDKMIKSKDITYLKYRTCQIKGGEGFGLDGIFFSGPIIRV